MLGRSIVTARGVDPGGWGSRTPDFGMWVLGGVAKYNYYMLIISNNVHEYEIKTRSKVVTFQK